jgi:hypothetical protein
VPFVHFCGLILCGLLINERVARALIHFMAKAVLSGRGDEIIDLARVNLLR